MSVSAYGQGEAPTALNTGVANFLTIATDARTAAMGGAGVAMTGGSAVFRNGAAVLQGPEERADVAYTYVPWMRDQASGFALHTLGGSYRISRRHAVWAGMRYFGYPRVQLTHEGSSSELHPKEMAFEAGYAYGVTEHLSVSATVRYLYLDMGTIGQNEAATTVVADVGVMYRQALAEGSDEYWTVGASLSNLGPKVSFLSRKESLPTFVRAGGAIEWPVRPAHRLVVTAEAGYRLAPQEVRAWQASAGLEYIGGKYIRLRGGYHYGDRSKGENSYATAGAGLAYRGLRADFAWLFGKSDCPLRNTCWLSLGMSF